MTTREDLKEKTTFSFQARNFLPKSPTPTSIASCMTTVTIRTTMFPAMKRQTTTKTLAGPMRRKRSSSPNGGSGLVDKQRHLAIGSARPRVTSPAIQTSFARAQNRTGPRTRSHRPLNLSTKSHSSKRTPKSTWLLSAISRNSMTKHTKISSTGRAFRHVSLLSLMSLESRSRLAKMAKMCIFTFEGNQTALSSQISAPTAQSDLV